MSVETIRAIEGIQGLEPREISGPAQAKGGVSFSETLGQALQSVDDLQVQADQQVSQVANGGGNLHEMSLALEKADVAMHLATKVRNKILDAYNEIMKMGV
jgi:flagellar hook-basal body complex protein FliE